MRRGTPPGGGGGGTPNDRPKVPNHEKITSGSSGSVSAPGIGSGMLLGTFLGSGDFIGVRCGRHGRGIDSFCSILSGGQAKCPYCSNCTLVRKRRAETVRKCQNMKKSILFLTEGSFGPDFLDTQRVWAGSETHVIDQGVQSPRITRRIVWKRPLCISLTRHVKNPESSRLDPKMKKHSSINVNS